MDGRTIAVGTEKKLVILGSETLNKVEEHELECDIYAMAFLSYGKYIVICRTDGIFSIHETSTLDAVFEYSLGCEVLAVAVSPDSQTMAVGGKDGNVVLLMISKLKGSKDPSLSVLKEHKREGEVSAVVFSPNGKYIAIGSGDGKVVLLHSSTLDVVEVFQQDGYEPYVRAETFSRNGKYLAVGGDDQLTIINTSTWEVVKEYKRSGCVNAVAFDPVSDIVAFGGDDYKVETFHTSVGGSYTNTKVTLR